MCGVCGCWFESRCGSGNASASVSGSLMAFCRAFLFRRLGIEWEGFANVRLRPIIEKGRRGKNREDVRYMSSLNSNSVVGVCMHWVFVVRMYVC